ncbi:MAG: hypothetical protein JST30_13160 [Armatimonadetes bacterium]|nr:hypothetical protein [Armatimonadota bacterium]
MSAVFIPIAFSAALAQMQHGQHGQHTGHDMRGAHEGAFTDAPMSQEGSGTSWLPSSSPHYAKMLPTRDGGAQHLMGVAFGGFTDAGGTRGESQWAASSMAMWSGKWERPVGTLSLRAMLSLDAWTNGRRGVPNLFQTGETEGGQPLTDRQHPHDFVAELAGIWSKKLSPDVRGFVYAGPIGEPALGGPMFMHRPSGFENPEAPISHHWFDSSHISFGVVTLGATMKDKWKIEASAFNGHEPDEDRFGIDPIALNSASTRLTYNPTPDWSLSASYGFLDSPEELEPGVDVHRTTASVTYNRPMPGGDLSAGLMFGRNSKEGEDTDAWNLEATYANPQWSVFGRWENVEKDELTGVPAGTYRINKFVFGATKNVAVRDGFEWGVGAYAGFYSFPSTLEPAYGRSPVSFGVFLRVRPTRM